MKLPTLLKSLHKDEHKELEKFLQSPFFKASEQYLAFFRHLCKQHPGFELERPELEAAYRACFGKQSLTESRFYNLLSGLGRQLEQYLAVKLVMPTNGEHESQLQKELLVRALGQRNMGPYFRMEAQRLVEALGAIPAKSVDDYHTLEQLHHQVYFNPDTPKYNTNSPDLPLAMQHLDIYYCVAKLRYAAEMKLRERLFQVQYDVPMLEAVLEMTAVPGLVEAHPLAAVYNRLVRLYLGGVNELDFRALKQLFAEKFQQLPREDQQILLQHLINSGISLVSRDCEVQEEMLSLYKIAIAANMLLDGNRITNQDFVNIVTLATRCKEFDWAKKFMEEFSSALEEEKRQPVIDLAAANLFYSQGKLDEAQKSLTPEIFKIPPFDIVARGLLLKIVFDLYIREGKNYEFLAAHLTAFEKFVNFKQLAEEKKNAYLNCIKFIRKIMSVKFELVVVPVEKKKNLRAKLNQLQPIVLKGWLKDCIENL